MIGVKRWGIEPVRPVGFVNGEAVGPLAVKNIGIERHVVAAGRIELAHGTQESLRIDAGEFRRKLLQCIRLGFRDAPDTGAFSQQTNVLAVLVDAVPIVVQRGVMERVLADTTLTPASYYFSFYVLEALRLAGLGDRYIEQLAPWQTMLRLGLTSAPENPEPTRSDTHAWAAHPNYGLLATVLGVRPSSSGFHTVRIAPALGPLARAEGRVPHPSGDIDVQLVREGQRGLRADVTLPRGLSGVLEWYGQRRQLRAGRQTIRLESLR